MSAGLGREDIRALLDDLSEELAARGARAELFRCDVCGGCGCGVRGVRGAGCGCWLTGPLAENSVVIMSRSLASSWISSSVGDRLITSVTAQVTMVIPTSRGTRNDPPPTPLMADIEPMADIELMDTLIAAIPV
jgi:hypothetical protein